jgi:MraZ protein
MFCGSFRYKINDRGKIIVPRHFRQGRKKAVIGVWPEGCLFLFSKKEWKRVKRMKLSPLEAANREEVRIIFSQTIEVEIDNGEFKIPEDLRKQAGLEKEVVIAGCGRYIELWDRKRWEIECERITTMMKALYDEEVIKIPLNISSN